MISISSLYKRYISLPLFSFFVNLIIIIALAEFLIGIFIPQKTYLTTFKNAINVMTNDSYIPFTLKPNSVILQHNSEGDYNVTAHINSLGFRGKELSTAKKPGTIRILILGDSQTFGWGVGDEETYSSRIEQILHQKGYPNIEVINAGWTSGFSPDTYYLFLKSRGMEFNPDIVLMGFFVYSDITDLSETSWIKTDENGLPEKIESCCNQVVGNVWTSRSTDFKYKFPVLRNSQMFFLLINSLQEKFHWFQKPKSATPGRDIYTNPIFDPGNTSFESEFSKTYQVIQATQNLTTAKNAKFGVILIPFDGQIFDQVLPRFGYEHYPAPQPDFLQKRIGLALTKRNIPFVDLYPVFNRQKDRGFPFFQHDDHMNPLGNQIEAEAISDYLIANKFIP
jgi:hypothetical protein